MSYLCMCWVIILCWAGNVNACDLLLKVTAVMCPVVSSSTDTDHPARSPPQSVNDFIDSVSRWSVLTTVFYLLVPVLAIIGIPIYDVRGTELSGTSDDSLFSFIISTVVAWYCGLLSVPTETIFSVWNPAQLIPNCAVLGPLESRGSISISQSSRIL